jgi:putative ABC transport system permease protein
MSFLDGLLHRVRAWLRPERHARELREEIDFHLSLDTMHQQQAGPADDARYAARRRFGNVTRYAEEAREMSGLGFLDMAKQDVRFALRTFRHAPAFTAVAVLTIALGIGATAAIFSVVNAVILKPLPYPDAERIVMVWMDNRRLGVKEDVHSYPNLADLKSQNRTLSHLAPFREAGFNLTGEGAEPMRVYGGALPAEVFAALGVRPVVGSLYTSANEQDGNDLVVVLSNALWKDRFGGQANVIGQQIELNGRKRTVVGVMPPKFAFPSEQSQLWVPLVIGEQMKTARSWYALPAIGRLKPRVSLAQARADLATVAARLAEQYPDNRDYGTWVVPLPEQVVGPTLRTALWIMLGAVAAVLLIACANVANLLLSRAAVREREVSVRMALGASTGRLVRQLLSESLVLSAIGGAVGVFLAWAGLRLLRALAPADLPRMDDVSVDGTVLLVTAGVTVLTGMLFGLVPAAQSSRTSLSETMREGGRGATSGRGGQRLRRMIVAAQLALVVVLLTGAGLLVRTFATLQGVQLGFNPENVLTVSLQLPVAKYPEPPTAVAFYQSLLDRVRAIPGVRAAGTVTTMFLSQTPNSGSIVVEGRPVRREDREVTIDGASPGFFETVGARLVRGRLFDGTERQDGQLVAVINEQMAKAYWPGVSPIGRRFRWGFQDSDTTQSPWRTVVGIVADMRRTGVDMPVREEAFVPYAQRTTLGNLVFVKTTGDPMAIVPRVRDVLRQLDPAQPITKIETLEQQLSGLIAQRRFNMTLVAAFAVLALVLAIIGAYGVTSYLVSQRTKELGVRLALGAQPSGVARLVVADGMRVAGVGVVVGVVAALFTTRLAASLLYGVSPRDPVTIAAVAVVLLTVAALANYLPARRAARVDPLVALRQE